MKQHEQVTSSEINFDTWRTQLINLIQCTRKLNDAFAQMQDGEIPETVDELIAQRGEIVTQLGHFVEILRNNDQIRVSQDILELYQEARSTGEEALQLLRNRRANILEEIKKLDRHQGHRNPYHTL